MGQKRWIAAIAITGFLGAAGIIMAAVLPSVIEKKVKSQAADQAMFTADNEKDWAHIPGDMKIEVHRDYYLYNLSLSNPDDLFKLGAEGKKIEVTKIGPFSYHERQDDLAIAYSDDREKVFIKPYTYYVRTDDSMDDETLITSINLGAYGVWYQTTQLETYKLAATALTTTYGAMMQSLWIDAFTLAIYYMNFKPSDTTPETTVKANFKKFVFGESISEELFEKIYADPRFGLQTPLTLSNWFSAAMNYPNDQVAPALQEYFLLSKGEMDQALGNFKNLTTDLQTVIEGVYQCTDDDCLAQHQWATTEVTSVPLLPQIPKYPSVINFNDTTSYAPEMGFYQKNTFIPSLPVDEQEAYSKVTWPKTLTKTLLKFDINGPVDTKDSLFNIGNMQFIFDTCQHIDETNLDNFQPISERFHLTNMQSRILWNYIRYILNKIGLAGKPQPSSTYEEFQDWKGRAAVLEIGSIALYQTTVKFYDHVGPLTHGTALFNKLKTLKDFTTNPVGACETLIGQIFTATEAKTLCSIPELKWTNDVKDYTQFSNWVDLCRDENSAIAQTVFKDVLNPKPGLADIQYQHLCTYTITKQQTPSVSNIEGDAASTVNFGDILGEALSEVVTLYGCQNSRGCTNNELMTYQWGECGVTPKYPKAWGIGNSPYMMDYVSEITDPVGWCEWQLSRVPKDQQSMLLWADANKIMTWMGMYSEGINESYLLESSTNPNPLNLEKPALMNEYYKYLVAEIAMGGLTQAKTAREWIFGFKDKFVDQVRTKNPLAGGDPTANPIIGFETNMTSTEDALSKPPSAVWTGKNHEDLVGRFYTYQGSETIAKYGVTYDGYTIKNGWTNPWGEEVVLKGSAGMHFQIGLEDHERIYVFINDLYRQGYGVQTDKFDYHNLPIQKYQLAPELLSCSEYNKKVYYDLIYEGMGNQTSIEQAPVFVSKPYFYQAEQAGQNTTIYSDTGDVLVPTPAVESFFYVEPYSGGAVKANEGLQGAVQLIPGFLIPDSPQGFLPLFYLHRYGGLDDAQISDTFGLLITALKVKHLAPLVGYPVGAFFVLMCGVSVYFFVKRRREAKKQNAVNSYHNINDSADSLRI